MCKYLFDSQKANIKLPLSIDLVIAIHFLSKIKEPGDYVCRLSLNDQVSVQFNSIPFLDFVK